MLGLVLATIVFVLAALALARAMSYPCHVQEGWSRVVLPGQSMGKGTAGSLYSVVRIAKKAGARSFNYNKQTKEYELLRDYLVNFTQPMDFQGGAIVPGVHVTGLLVDPASPPPAPCCEKIKCEMRAFGLDPDGNMKRDWDKAGPYYDVAAAAASWPKSAAGRPLPPAGPADHSAYVDYNLTSALKAPGAKAPAGLDASGALQYAQSPQCPGCDICSPSDKGGCNAKYWFGCNERGQLYNSAAKNATY